MQRKAKAWFDGLSKAGRVGVVGLASVVLLGGVSAMADPCKIIYANETVTESVAYSVTKTKDPSLIVGTSKVQKAGVEGKNEVTYKVGTKCGEEVSKEAIKTVEKSKPVAEERLVGSKEVVTETQDVAIPFGNQDVPNASMDKGKTTIAQAGVNGSKKVTYEVVKIDGQEQSRAVINEQVTKEPVAQITHYGTKVAAPQSNCDSNYAGGCVPVASDVDCGSGSGNGPAYFYGTARVVGYDVYGLDRDNDGYACE